MKIKGRFEIIVRMNREITIKINMSFSRYTIPNSIFSILLLNPRGLEDPVLCRRTKWMIEITATIKGRMKCKEKNRPNVG
jgi:hypothetical protein